MKAPREIQGSLSHVRRRDLRTRPTYPCNLDDNLNWGADWNELVELDHIRVFQADAAGAGGSTDQILAVGAVDVDVAVLAGLVMGLFAIEPEDAGEN